MNLNNQTTVNVQEKSNLIWAIADLIRDFYKPHEYGKPESVKFSLFISRTFILKEEF